MFEIDLPEMTADKLERLSRAGIRIPENTHFVSADLRKADWREKLCGCPGFSGKKRSFCSLLGISYYLSADAFRDLLRGISDILPDGSAIAFDYPDFLYHSPRAGERTGKQAMLAKGAGEAMTVGYSYAVLEAILSQCGFLVYEHLEPEEITGRFFLAHNEAEPKHSMTAFDHVNYCLAVKKS